MKNATIQALNTCEVGTRGIVVTIKGDKEFQKRLISMGLHTGCDVEVLHQGENSPPMLIVVGETRLALDQEMSTQILLAPLAETHSSSSWTKTTLKHRFRNIWHGGHHEKMFRRFKRRKQGKNYRIREGEFGLS
jgi:Fe2+ transport system protein FeoA